MRHAIEQGYMAFLAEGREGVGAVRSVADGSITIYIENAGEFLVPLSAVKKVHDGKVILDATRLGDDILKAVGHAHDREDPNVAG